jgi:hypothetical protein
VGFQPAEIEVEFKWPVLFIVAALAGAAFGGVVGAVQARKRESATSTAGNAVRGLLVGLFVAATYFGVGLNLLQFDVKVQFFNEIAVFAFAALGGAFGAPALAALRSKG